MQVSAPAITVPELRIASSGDVRSFIEETDCRTQRYRWLILLSFAGVAFEAYFFGASSAGLGQITRELHLTPFQVAVFSALGNLINLFIGLATGWLADRFGRVRLIVFAKLVAAIGAVMMTIATGYGLLLLGRAVSGLAFGLDFGVAMAFIAEYLSKSRRGWITMWQGQWYVATTLALLVSLVAYSAGAVDDAWRWAMGLTIVLALALLVLQWLFLAESPLWLARTGQLDRAAASLRAIYKIRVRVASPGRTDPVGDPSQHAHSHRPTSWTALFRPPYRKRTILSTTDNLTQALQYFGIGFYLPVISLQLFGHGFTIAAIGSIVFNLFGIVGGFSGVWLARRFGIRRMAMIGFAVVLITLATLGIFFARLPLMLGFAIPALFILFHSAGPGAAALTMPALAYRSEVRAQGTQLTNIMGSLGGSIGLFVFPLIQSTFGVSGAILMFAAAPLVGFLTCLVIKWEPMDTEPDVEAELIGVAPA